MEVNNHYVWVIAYIDKDFLDKATMQLKKYPEYAEVEAFIPTVKILKKTFKGVDRFDEIPLLFNYGFFKIPRKFAINKDYLEQMQKNISCIYGWVKDPLNSSNRITVGLATSDEIAQLIRSSVNLGAHSSEDLGMIKSGDMITLRGYPFDDIQAEFVSMDEKRKKVKVKIPLLWNKETEVSFDNVFFTIYHNNNYDDAIDNRNSLDDTTKTQKILKNIHRNAPQ